MNNIDKMEKEVLAFGAGNYYIHNKDLIREEYNIIAFCDNDEKKVGTVYDGKPVISVGQLMQYTGLEILITSIHKYEIIEQLLEEGIEAERICFMIPDWMKEICSLVRIGERGGIELCIRGTFMVLHNDLEEMICREVWYNEDYNINLQTECIVIDIGLNVGFATLFFADKAFVKKIYAFEPDKKVYDKAVYNIGLNENARDFIETYNVACSDCNKKEFYVNHRDPLFISAGIRKIRTGDAANCETIQVECVDSAEILGKIIDNHLGKEKIVLKCDCEGAEYEIFYRLEESGYFNKIDVVVMEWHIGRREDIEKIFSRNNYIYFITTTPGRTFGKCYAIKQR